MKFNIMKQRWHNEVCLNNALSTLGLVSPYFMRPSIGHAIYGGEDNWLLNPMSETLENDGYA